MTTRRKWNGATVNLDLANQMSHEFNLHPLVARVLASRHPSIKSAQSFLNTSRADIHDPFLMYEMERAISRIHRAIKNDETIWVVGDYDVDGVTVTTILVRTLHSMGANVRWYVPSRFTDGYGLHSGIVDQAYADGATLIITVDNGISAHEAIAHANKLGMTVIVTDHHHIGQKLPDAYATLHPNHPYGEYPFADLCGAGVAFKLAHALLGRLPEEYLDLVALGTVADQVSLVGENRALVKEGLVRINSGNITLGLAALMGVAGIRNQRVTSTDFAFKLAPRINAVGRLADASMAVELLLTSDPRVAMDLAHKLNRYNEQRKVIQERIEREAIEQINTHFEWVTHGKSLVVAGEGWHEGVIGIVASHLVDYYSVPALCISVSGDTAKGSGRSVEEVNLYDILDVVQQQTGVLTKWGGHAAAAGFSLASGRVDELRAVMGDVMQDVEWEPHIVADAPLQLGELSFRLLDDLKRLEPFGNGNEEPVLFVRDARVRTVYTMGADKQHLKVIVSENGGIGFPYQMVAFGHGDEVDEWRNARTRHLLVTLNENVWNDEKSIQLMMVDAK
jgi:single-stranded-DNA-specific exonuclease